MPAVIKSVPEDFVVKERILLDAGSSGPYSYYMLRKRGYSTQKAVESVARAFRKKLKYINFAGNKDKYAVTEQHISILHGPARDLDLGDIKLTFLGRGRERINLGSAEGNDFEITVRNIERRPKPPECVPNYFDSQRFGRKENNHIAGKLIVTGKYKEACSLIPETRERLKENPNDFVGALRSLPKRVLRLYPHAYQSFLWNSVASEYIAGFRHWSLELPFGTLRFPEERIASISVPVPGYTTTIPDSVIGNISRKVLSEERISLNDFRQKTFPEFDLRGGERILLASVSNLAIGRLEEDELNPGMKKCRISFSLGSGSYATVVIRAMFRDAASGGSALHGE